MHLRGSALLTQTLCLKHRPAGLQGALCPVAPLLSWLQGRNGHTLSPHPRLLQALCSSATPRPGPPQTSQSPRHPGANPALGSQCSQPQVSDGSLVLPHGPGSQDTGRVQPGAESDLGDTGPAGGSKAAGPGADWPPPSSGTDGRGSLRDMLSLALTLPPSSHHSSTPAAKQEANPGPRPRGASDLGGAQEQHSGRAGASGCSHTPAWPGPRTSHLQASPQQARPCLSPGRFSRLDSDAAGVDKGKGDPPADWGTPTRRQGDGGNPGPLGPHAHSTRRRWRLPPLFLLHF